MSTVCDEIKEKLLSDEPLGELEHHLNGCPECLELRENLLQLNSAFAELPEIAPSESVVEQSLQRLTEKKVSRRPSPIVVGVMLFAALTLTPIGRSLVRESSNGSLPALVSLLVVCGMCFLISLAVLSPDKRLRFHLLTVGGTLATACFAMIMFLGQQASKSFPSIGSSIGIASNERYDEAKSPSLKQKSRDSAVNYDGAEFDEQEMADELKSGATGSKKESSNELAQQTKGGYAASPELAGSSPSSIDASDADVDKIQGLINSGSALGKRGPSKDFDQSNTRVDKLAELETVAPHRQFVDKLAPKNEPVALLDSKVAGKTAAKARAAAPIDEDFRKIGSKIADMPAFQSVPGVAGENLKQSLPTSKWDEFLRLRQQTTGLNYQNPVGYWGNTYLPGNPMMRSLQLAVDQSLANSPASDLLKSILELAAKPVQPFDAPINGALGVQLTADTRAVNGEQRVLLQIGIRGADRLGASRQAMRQAVVVDLRVKPSEKAIGKLKALLLAIDQNKESRDRIAMMFVSPSGIQTIEPNDLRYGTISTLFAEHLAESPANACGSMAAALEQAITRIASDTNPESAFSAPAVLIVSAASLESDLSELKPIAYTSSLQGVPVSVISASDVPNTSTLDSLAIAGRGRAKVLDVEANAGELVRNEMVSAGRVVAQAVRLNLKLSPGVRLVEVVDSQRLDQKSVQEVKAAESAVDKRLSAALSIPMDRGQDGDGIQVIIPAFYGGDSHVILVDVVTSGPGTVATLTAQFKDLVQLENKKVEVGLNLDNGERQFGRSEYSVLHNYLSLKMSDELKNAARAVRAGDLAQATSILHQQLELFQSLQQSELEHSSDSRSVINLLTNGLAALQSSPNQRTLSLVLEYAALSRVNNSAAL